MKIVLDIASVIWDKVKYDVDSSCYYDLANEVLLFIDSFYKCKLDILIQQKLLDEVLKEFPFDLTENNVYYKEFRTNVYGFLSRISNTLDCTNISLSELTTIPNVFYTHFSKTVLSEYKYLIYNMHISDEIVVFCTFNAIWNNGNKLKTANNTIKEHHTVIHAKKQPTIKDYFLNEIRNIFEHNPKHSCKSVYYSEGEKINPLSCFDERNGDTTIPQGFLDKAQKYGNELYYYDNEKQCFVCFKSHSDRKYHGYDLYDEDITDNNLRTFLQKIKEEVQND